MSGPTIKTIWSRKRRLLATTIAVVLGVAFLAATMVLGDTNSGRPGIDEETPVFGPREDAWLSGLEQSGWLDAFRLLRGTARAYTWYSPNGGNGFRLDQAFVNDQLRPRLRNVHYDWGRRIGSPGRRISDHAALLVDLRS